MTTHTLDGLHPRSLATYLAALGLVRVIGRQADAATQAYWKGDALIVRCGLTDLARWLVHDYRPSPIVSPWNGGSGFGAKDKKPREVLDRIGASSSHRVAELQTTVALASQVAGAAVSNGWTKGRLVSELRNRCPETLLGWLDACVIIRDEGALFPPLLGTGGNDGRLDFSTNFHQRLLETLPELGADAGRSEQWAEQALHGGSGAALVLGAIGQFDPAGAGGRNSSTFGAADSLVNPWTFVLMMEGVTHFASGLARRQGGGSRRAAMPFCVYSSPDGPTPGAYGETSRGEIWTPVWLAPLSRAEIDQLFVESRATWQGQTASQATEMYAALKAYGVSRGIDRFIRYGLHQRNGLAFSAVRLDEVDVRARPAVALSVEPARVMKPFGPLTAGAVVSARRRFDRHHLAYARDVRAEDLRDMLAEQTLTDLAVQRSTASREALGRRPALPRADRFVDYLHDNLSAGPEFRVGVALASAGYPDASGQVLPVRQLIVGRLPAMPREQWVDPQIRGLGLRSLAAVLADAVVWRARQAGQPGPVQRGFVPFPVHSLTVPWQEVHAWVSGRLDEHAVLRAFLASLALDWRGVRRHWSDDGAPGVPNPELAVLQTFATGRVAAGSVGDVSAGEPIRYGLQRDWPGRLLAEGPTAVRSLSTSAVIAESVGLLDRLGRKSAVPARTDATREHLLAALLASPSISPLRRLGVRRPHDEPAAAN